MNNPIPSCTISLSLSAEEALAEFIKLTAMTAAQRGDDSTLVFLRQVSVLMRLNRATNPYVQRCMQALTTVSLICDSLTLNQRAMLEIACKKEAYDLSVRHALEQMMDCTVSFILQTYPSDSKNLSRNTFRALYLFFDTLCDLVYSVYQFDSGERKKDDNICCRDAEFYAELYQEAYENYDEQENQA